MSYKFTVLALALVLSACGSSDDSEGSRFKKTGNTSTQAELRNVALKDNGGAIRDATYDANAAKYTIDGDRTASNFWAGNTTNESFVVGFSNSAELSRVDIYTNISSGSVSNPPITIEISTNQRSWVTMVDTASNGGIQCSNSGFSGNVFICIMSNESARYIRIGTKDSSTSINEVEVYGK